MVRCTAIGGIISLHKGNLRWCYILCLRGILKLMTSAFCEASCMVMIAFKLNCNYTTEGTKGYFVKIGKVCRRMSNFCRSVNISRNSIMCFVSSTVLHFNMMTKTHRNQKTLSCWSSLSLFGRHLKGRGRGGRKSGSLFPRWRFSLLPLRRSLRVAAPPPVSPLSQARACESKT